MLIMLTNVRPLRCVCVIASVRLLFALVLCTHTNTATTMKINYKMIIKQTEWIWGELVAKLVYIIQGSPSGRLLFNYTVLFVVCLDSRIISNVFPILQ